MKSLRTDPEAARAVFETMAARLDAFAQDLVADLAEAGHDKNELGWIFAQTALSLATAAYMEMGCPVDQLVEQIRRNWELNEKLRQALSPSTLRGQG